MPHHYSGPDFGFPRGDARLDFTDLYALAQAGRQLPDLLSYDPARPASIPDNGRTPTDDAFDSFLCVLTNGRVTDNGIEPHHAT
jgi:hypothetical protein